MQLKIETVIHPSAASLANVLSDYWKVGESGNFNFTIEEVALKHKISITKLKKVVDDYSFLSINNNECRCGFPLHVDFKKREEFVKYVSSGSWKNPPKQCSTCATLTTEKQKHQAELTAKAKEILRFAAMNDAVRLKTWRLLDNYEMEVLKTLIRTNPTFQFTDVLFHEEDGNNRSLFQTIEKLEQLALLAIDRQDGTNDIKSISILPTLKQELSL